MKLSEKQFLILMLRRFRDADAYPYAMNFAPSLRVTGIPVESFAVKDSPYQVEFNLKIAFDFFAGFNDPFGDVASFQGITNDPEGIRIFSTTGVEKKYDQAGIFKLLTRAAIPTEDITFVLQGFARRAERITARRLAVSEARWRSESAGYAKDIVDLRAKIAAFVKTTSRIKRQQALARLDALEAFVVAQSKIAALTGLM